MTTPVPPGPPPVSGAAVSSGTSMVASIPAPPPALTSLPPGTPVQAVILGTPTRGEVLLNTPLGDVTLRTAQFLPADRALTLVYLGTGAQGQALVRLSWPAPGVPGTTGGTLAPGLPPGPASGTLTSGGAPVASATGLAVPALPPGGMSASIVGPPAGPWAGTLPAGVSPLPPGSLLVVRIVDIAPALSGNATQAAVLPPSGGAGSTITQSVMAYNTIGKILPGSLAGTAPALFPVDGNPAPERLSTGVPQDGTKTSGPSGPSSGATATRGTGPFPLPPGLQIPGTIISTGTASASLVDTALGRLAINATLPGETGTTIRLQILSAGRSLPLPGILPAPLASGSGWPALQEAISLSLATGAATRATETGALMDAMIRPGPAMTVNALAFLACLRRGGDTGIWPGKRALRDLERLGSKGKALAERLGGDLGRMAAETREASPSTQDWRVLTLPVLNDGEITPVRLITRRHAEGDTDRAESGGHGGPGERFLVDVALSRLGPIQLDGLFQKKGRQLDLVVRSRTTLSRIMHRDIRALYNESLSGLGFRGSLRFEAGGPFFELPPPPPPPERPGPDRAGIVI